MDTESAEKHQNLRVAVEKGRTDVLQAVIGGTTRNMTNGRPWLGGCSGALPARPLTDIAH